MRAPRLIFLAGMPSAGKSWFGAWLSSTHGYLHVDAEVAGELERCGLRDVWEHSCARNDVRPLAEELTRRKEPTIFNWGFPISCMALARSFGTAGFTSWWFDADSTVARRSHIGAGKDRHGFDSQVAAIASSRDAIDEIFGPNVLVVLNAQSKRLTPEAIFGAMCRDA